MKNILVPVLTIFVLSALAFGASKEKTLYTFQGGSDGMTPETQLITDSHGNLYGVTEEGGINCGFIGLPYGCGTVFELIAPSSPAGTWQEAVLYSFHGPDGALPHSSLTFDKAGNLYGVTGEGGDLSVEECSYEGCGVVFELSPPGEPGGNWTEMVLHTFEGGTDGANSASPVVFDSNGNLYGVAPGGVNAQCGGCGVAYELSPSSNGWIETILYTFSGNGDGVYPWGSIVLDSAGNLYGTTVGASNSPATAFELSPSSPGQSWTETTIAEIGAGGEGLVQGEDGNLYGSTTGADYRPPGTLFQLTLSGGVWTQNVICTFTQEDGISSPGPVTIDAKLNIYLSAGPPYGTVYKFAVEPGNTWKPSELYRFTNRLTGYGPGALAFGKWGALYGATVEGGPNNAGVVFGLAP